MISGAVLAEPHRNKTDMKKDTAIVMSCHEHEAPATWRINLKWQGNQKIADFDLDHLGAIQRSEAETEHTGYVIVKSHANPNIGDTIPAR